MKRQSIGIFVHLGYNLTIIRVVKFIRGEEVK